MEDEVQKVRRIMQELHHNGMITITGYDAATDSYCCCPGPVVESWIETTGGTLQEFAIRFQRAYALRRLHLTEETERTLFNAIMYAPVKSNQI